MKAWHKFHSALTACIKGATQFDEKAEAEFLKLKSQIAILHDSFIEAMDNPDRETAATSQSVISIVESCIMLKRMGNMSQVELKRMENEWHQAYLLINDTIGILEDQMHHLEHISHARHTAERLGKKVRRGSRAIAGSWQAKIGAIFVVVLALLLGLPTIGVFSYDFLIQNDMTKKPYMVARSVLRKSVAKGMGYATLEEYEIYGKSDTTYEPFDLPAGSNQQQALRKSLLTVDTQADARFRAIEPLSLEEDLSGAQSGELKTYKRDEKTMGAALVFLLGSELDARRIETKRADWIQNLPADNTGNFLRTACELVKLGHKNNVLYCVWSQDPGFRDELASKYAGF